jgi:hypothetical protein
LGNLSGTLEKLGDYLGAKEGYLKALEIFKKNFGEEHAQFVSTLGSFSGALTKLGDY